MGGNGKPHQWQWVERMGGRQSQIDAKLSSQPQALAVGPRPRSNHLYWPELAVVLQQAAKWPRLVADPVIIAFQNPGQIREKQERIRDRKGS